MHSQWLIAAITDAQLLIATGCFLILGTGISCLVYAFASLWITQKQERLDALEKDLKALKDGMKRAGTWRSEYERPSPPPFKINQGSA